MKKSLALMFNAFWINRAGMSGGDRRCMEIFRRIGHHFELTAYTSEDGKRTLEPCLPHASFVVMPPHLLEENLYGAYVSRARWALRQIRDQHYDIIYASSDFFPDSLPASAHRKMNPESRWVQCVFHVYPPLSRRPGSLLRNWLGKSAQQFSFSAIKRRADTVVNLNSSARSELVSLGFPAERITVNPCGIDTEICASVNASRQEHQGCFVGRLSPTKGIFDLVDVWRPVAKLYPDAILKVIGNGPDKVIKQLQREIDRSDIASNIQLCGFLDDADAMRTLKESSIFLMPSYEEGFGIAIAEAMACGVPCVAWNLPVYDEVYPDGLIKVPLGNRKLFSQEILTILNNRQLAEIAIAAGHETIRRYDWDSIAETELNLITTQ